MNSAIILLKFLWIENEQKSIIKNWIDMVGILKMERQLFSMTSTIEGIEDRFPKQNKNKNKKKRKLLEVIEDGIPEQNLNKKKKSEKWKMVMRDFSHVLKVI